MEYPKLFSSLTVTFETRKRFCAFKVAIRTWKSYKRLTVTCFVQVRQETKVTKWFAGMKLLTPFSYLANITSFDTCKISGMAMTSNVFFVIVSGRRINETTNIGWTVLRVFPTLLHSLGNTLDVRFECVTVGCSIFFMFSQIGNFPIINQEDYARRLMLQDLDPMYPFW